MSTCGCTGRLCTAVHTPGVHRSARPVYAQRPPSHGGTGASVEIGGAGYRQRIDMTSPSTMAPKPMAKFHAPSDTMNGIWSPAT